MDEKYFAASNSGCGFKSFFKEIFDPEKLEHIYIIKGGPGTGKSYFMKRISEEARKRNKKVVSYYCSSDQNSLDGIVIDGRIGVLDGTAPHQTDAVFPGVSEDIIDLGVFWNSGKLALSRDKIIALNREKKLFYECAYKYLAAYHDISEAIEKPVSYILKHEELEKYVAGIMKNIQRGSEYRAEIAISASVGMEGYVRTESLAEKADIVYSVTDVYGSAHNLLKAVANAAMAKNLHVVLSYDPINTDRLDGIYLCDSKLLFTSALLEGARKISMSRFFDRESSEVYKKNIKSGMKLREAALKEAISALSVVKKVHFSIEEIYKEAMDFDAKEKFTENFIKKLIP